MAGNSQYLRKCGLVVFGASQGPVAPGTQGPSGGGLDLSALRIKFQIMQMDADAPGTALIKVYNLSSNTSKKIQKEFQSVTLQAGYENGNYGVIFQGSIKQTRRGRDNNTETFLEIMASDLDEFYNFSTVSTTLKAGSSAKDQINAVVQAGAAQGASQGFIPSSLGTGGTLPRGKVLFGLGRDRLSDVAQSTQSSWSIVNGQVQFVNLTGYAPGQAVVINSQSGLIGVPEATINGVEATILLNPFVKLGTRVQINNADVNQTTVNSQGFPRFTDLTFPASVSEDGFYRVLVAEHRGDTWGQEWYTDLTCLALDPSAAPGSSVMAYG
jgi:hypothetical protein